MPMLKKLVIGITLVWSSHTLRTAMMVMMLVDMIARLPPHVLMIAQDTP